MPGAAFPPQVRTMQQAPDSIALRCTSPLSPVSTISPFSRKGDMCSIDMVAITTFPVKRKAFSSPVTRRARMVSAMFRSGVPLTDRLFVSSVFM